jgi:hypothetical protein
MSKVYLASFKGTHPGWQGIINIGIRVVTQGMYSHSEIVVGDDPFNKPAWCASSTGVEKGVRGKVMQLDPKDWDLIEIDWVTEEEVRDWVNRHQEDGYDYIGDVRFLIPFIAQHAEGYWFCSEMCAEILGFEKSWRYDPTTLPSAVKNMKRVRGK